MKMASENEIKRRNETSVAWLARIYRPPERTPPDGRPSNGGGGTPDAQKHGISKAKLDYLALRAGEPFGSLTGVDKQAGISRGRGSTLRKALEREELIKMHRIKTGRRGGQIKVTEITDKGYELLKQFKVPVQKPAGRGSYGHKWWQWIICEFFERRGAIARPEQEVASKAIEVGVTQGERSVAVEVVNEGLDKDLSNVAKDLEAGWDEVWLCAAEQRVLDGLRDRVSDTFGVGLLDSERVRFKRLPEFLPKKTEEQGPVAWEPEGTRNE